MADTSSRNQNLISTAVRGVEEILGGRTALKAFREQILALGPGAVLTPEAFAGNNKHIGPADFPPVLAALDALEAVLVDPRAGEPTEHLRALLAFSRGA